MLSGLCARGGGYLYNSGTICNYFIGKIKMLTTVDVHLEWAATSVCPYC